VTTIDIPDMRMGMKRK